MDVDLFGDKMRQPDLVHLLKVVGVFIPLYLSRAKVVIETHFPNFLPRQFCVLNGFNEPLHGLYPKPAFRGRADIIQSEIHFLPPFVKDSLLVRASYVN